jgi:NAD(P)-dependent dehydrogenase (short-subunit alcohol dehydrogenase family)
MKHPENKVAILTGAAGGIGIHIARALAQEGAKVLLTDLDEHELASLAGVLGSDCAHYAADLADENAPQEIIVHCKKRFGGLDILINNAAIASRKPILEVVSEGTPSRRLSPERH